MKDKKTKIKRIFLASDHAGYKLKSDIKNFLLRRGEKVLDLGTENTNSVDYPDYAHLLSKKIKNTKNNVGILVCGSGTGMAMTANKHKNVRAALCYNVKSTKLSRKHNNANVMTLGARLIKKKDALMCVKAFLGTEFESGRHTKRINKI